MELEAAVVPPQDLEARLLQPGTALGHPAHGSVVGPLGMGHLPIAQVQLHDRRAGMDPQLPILAFPGQYAQDLGEVECLEASLQHGSLPLPVARLLAPEQDDADILTRLTDPCARGIGVRKPALYPGVTIRTHPPS